MIPDRDIHHYTQVLVKHHGEGASIRASTRANTMLESGDLDSYRMWKRILRVVEELQGAEPEPGVRVH